MTTLIDSLLNSRSDIHSGDFSLSDARACDTCKHPDDCDRAVLRIHSDIDVAVIDMDEWKASHSDTQSIGKICDYLLYDAEDQYASRKVAFCDLTCSTTDYVNPGKSTKYPKGKRAYAIEQMTHTVEMFFSRPVVDQQIATATDRRIIFGVRFSDLPIILPAAKSMSAFTRTPSSTAGIVRSQQTIGGIGFTYVEVRYPERMRW